MNFFRKHLFPTAAVLLLAFLTLLSLETSHHHGALEDNDNCSVCSWQQTSPSTTAFVSPFLAFVALFFAMLFTFSPSPFSLFFLSIPGRSPPKNLL